MRTYITRALISCIGLETPEELGWSTIRRLEHPCWNPHLARQAGRCTGNFDCIGARRGARLSPPHFFLPLSLSPPLPLPLPLPPSPSPSPSLSLSLSSVCLSVCLSLSPFPCLCLCLCLYLTSLILPCSHRRAQAKLVPALGRVLLGAGKGMSGLREPAMSSGIIQAMHHGRISGPTKTSGSLQEATRERMVQLCLSIPCCKIGTLQRSFGQS
jgi:hypothetical protein